MPKARKNAVRNIRAWRTKARGGTEANPKISICFDEATFNRLAAKAQQRRISFGSLVREIVSNATI